MLAEINYIYKRIKKMGEQSKLKDIGALWIRTSQAGNMFLSGNITIDGIKHDLLVFENKTKEGKQPDYKISCDFDKSKAVEVNNER